MGIGQSDLLLLVAIAERGSLTGAARQLGVQKSTVSRDLALLEARLGHRLVERTTRQLRLTEAGELLLGFA
jgi:molybdate transport repressor ModE-like protein